jgi:DnaJ-domain-containing protein 1
MKPGSQLLMAARLLSSNQGFSAQLNLISSSGQIALYCYESSVLFVESSQIYPPEVLLTLNLATTDQDKLKIVEDLLKSPEQKGSIVAAAEKVLLNFFSTPLSKCELKQKPYENGLTMFTILALLHDYATEYIKSTSFEDLLPDNSISFQLAPGAMERSTQFRMSPQEGYLLSRLDAKTSLADIFSTVPGDEDEIKRNLLLLWASSVIDSPNLEKIVPRVQATPAAPASAPASGPASKAPSRDYRTPVPHMKETTIEEDLQLVKVTYDKLSRNDFYALLGVSARADLPEIKTAYYKLARRFHPDRYYGLEDPVVREKVDVIFSAVNVAYETLKNQATRVEYDNAPIEQKVVSTAPLLSEAPKNAPSGPEAAARVAEDYYKRGRHSYESGNFYESAQFLRSATQINPGIAKYWRQLGLALSKNPQWGKEAEDSLNRAVELEPKNADNHLYLGLLFKTMGMKLRAKKHLGICLEMEPTNDMAARELSHLEADDSSKKGRLGGIFKKKG